MKNTYIKSAVQFGIGSAVVVAGNLMVRHKWGISGAIATASGSIVASHAITDAAFVFPEAAAS